MKISKTLYLLALSLLAVSCARLPAGLRASNGPGTGPDKITFESPGERLATAEELAANGKFKLAEEVLAPLIGSEFKNQRVTALAKNIEQGEALEPLPEPEPQEEEPPGIRQTPASGEPETRPPAPEQAPPTESKLEADREIPARELAGHDPERELRKEVTREAIRRLKLAEKQMGRGEFDKARANISPLMGQTLYGKEAAEIAAEIERLRAEEEFEAAQDNSAARAMREVRERMILPENYGRTVVISPDLKPLDLPPGPMEELVNKKVTMKLEDADVKMVVSALSEIDKMNIIADDALTELKKLTIDVHDVPLQELLSYISRNMGIAFHLGENTIWVTESTEPPGTGPELETRIYRLRHGFFPFPPPKPKGSGGDGGGFGGGKGGVEEGTPDNDLEDALVTFLSNGPEEATYRLFKNRNVLMVKNSRENQRLVAELIREFDKPPLQVLIEARFVTIAWEDLAELGFDIPEFDLEGRDPDTRSEIMTLSAPSNFEDFKNADSGANLTLTGILGNHTYKAVMHALETTGKAKTLSAPRVTVLNNQSAEIRKGDKMYYFEEYDTVTSNQRVTDDNGTYVSDVDTLVPSGKPKELELGITLQVKVNIGNDAKTVNLSLTPEIKQFVKWLNFTVADDNNNNDTDDTDNESDSDQPTGLISLPKTNESIISTTVVVDSGETVVLGGMVQNQQSHNVEKVPILGDIPYLGFLFRHNEIIDEPQHLLIFVTATIINPSGENVDAEPVPAELQ